MQFSFIDTQEIYQKDSSPSSLLKSKMGNDVYGKDTGLRVRVNPKLGSAEENEKHKPKSLEDSPF